MRNADTHQALKIVVSRDEQAETLHHRIRQARAATFATARAASEHLEIPYGTYTGYETGARTPDIKDIPAIAAAFNVTPQWLAWGIVDGPTLSLPEMLRQAAARLEKD